MARQKVQQQVVVAHSKAVLAAHQQSSQRGDGGYDASKLEIHHECDPIPLGRDGVLSVQVYSYNGSTPRIGVYRVGVSPKTGKTWQVKELRPLSADQAADFAKKLIEAATELKQLLLKQGQVK